MSETQFNFFFLLIGTGQLTFAALVFFGIDFKSFKRGRASKGSLADITLTPKRTMTRPTLVLLLILFGFVFAGYGFYRTFAYPPSSPSQAKEIDRLRAAVKKFEDRAAEEDADAWTPLTKEQISIWARELKQYPPRDITVFYTGGTNAGRFFRSLQALGKQVGFKVEYGLGYSDGPDIEMSITPGDKFGLALSPLLRGIYPVKLTERPVNSSEPDNGDVSIYLPPN
jgi:hypothetical protein